MKATKRHLIGRTIVAVDFRRFPHYEYPDKMCHDPVLTLDNGRRVWFVTQETGGPEYGTLIAISEVSKPKRALKRGATPGKIGAMKHSIGFTSQVYYKICDAERALKRPLSRGEKADLILDNFANVKDSKEAHEILDVIYGGTQQ